ncbi:MAG: protein kinase, partial [Verrucomicrobiota bacterium]
MNSSDSATTADPPLGGLDPEKLLAAALRSSPVTLPSHDWEPPPAAVVDGWFAEYEVDRLIGRGAMGAVYHAVHSRLGRDIAIKLLPAVLAQREEMAARFEREARALARLSHPNIVGLHDFGRTESGHLFIVMEHVAGADLSRLIRGGDLSVTQALEIIGQVCDALQYAHSQGFVHRDIKPGNILVDTTGRVRIADFGLTKLLGGEAGHPHAAGRTLTGAALGTPEYTAPEQLRGGTVDHRADIYSLGVMLYEMLTGDLPRGAWAPPSQRSAADARLDEVVTRAMQNEPDKRYQQAGEVKTAIHAPTAALTSSAAIPSAGKVSRFHGNVWLAVIFFVCAVWLAAMIPQGNAPFAIQVSGPLVLIGLWFLSRPRKPAAWHGLIAGLTIGATAAVGLYLAKSVADGKFEPAAARPAEEAVIGEKLNQSKARTARILSGIDEALGAQQEKVAELGRKLRSMRSNYGIVDSGAAGGANSLSVIEGEDEAARLKRREAVAEMEKQLARLESQLAAARLSPDQFYAAAGVENETLRAFHSQWKKDESELARMLSSGFAKNHPRARGLAASIEQEKKILEDAAKNHRTSLDISIRNLRDTIDSNRRAAQGGQGAGLSATPERMEEYNELKLRYEIAAETLNELNKSAAQLTMGALGLFQQEVDKITRYKAPVPESAIPEPPKTAASPGTQAPPSKADSITGYERPAGADPAQNQAPPAPAVSEPPAPLNPIPPAVEAKPSPPPAGPSTPSADSHPASADSRSTSADSHPASADSHPASADS